jgi:hypothetical protein
LTNSKPEVAIGTLLVQLFPQGSAPYGLVVAYVSVGSQRYRISMKGGSGDGTTNTCTTNHGWLPNGIYGRGASDPKSKFDFIANKTWGSTVIRGSVWFLDRMDCPSGIERSELFMHTQSNSATTNYKSQGCIKINHPDRDYLASMYSVAYSRSNGRMQVY